jgi:hypothetical protein
MKKCIDCKISLSLNEFCKNKTQKDGLNRICKKCMSVRTINRYQNNKEKILSNQKIYYHNNKDIIIPKYKAQNKKWRVNNPDKIKEYYEKNKEKIKQYLKDYQKKKQKQKYHSDPKYRYDKIMSNNIRSFLKGKKNKKTKELLGYEYKDFKNKIGEIPEKYHIDHKIPVSWFIETTPINIIWNLNNIQVLSPEDNKKKYNKYSDQVCEEYLATAIKYIKEEYLPKINLKKE